MKAIILSGGYGSRLRPLTLTRPKSIVEFCNVPIIEFQIAQFSSISITDIIIALNYKAEELIPYLKRMEKKYGVSIHLSVEEKPLGTAGPIRLAKNFLTENEPFFVCNSDIICDFPLVEMIDMYNSKNMVDECQGIILVKRVLDPSKYGVVIHCENTYLVDRFVEKPKQFIGDFINAGIYILSSKIIDLIAPDVPVSIEREIFPLIASKKKLFCHRFYNENHVWADIGNPRDYLIGSSLFLEFFNLNTNNSEKGFETELSKTNLRLFKELIDNNELKLLAKSNTFEVQGNNMIHKTVTIGVGCKIGPNVIIGRNCVIGDGVRLKDCTIFGETIIGNFSNIFGSIIGWNCKIGKWTRIEGLTVLGDEVSIRDELQVISSIILPNKSIESSINTPNTICL
ncbi:GDP-mannose pyrophosphorylase [Cryptosporidium ryanae]|uniref:GDP-mannose pyrophosphorylase n=1 Tax=Cryptosporidium ryanae TaxID=515981 RepID=UPI00351A0531|nr:GDP-mannose pyrophosphorylase [Cryptosporidium ryanae]